MERLLRWQLNGTDFLYFAVVDPSNRVVSMHQNADAAIRFVATCYRTDLRVVEVF